MRNNKLHCFCKIKKCTRTLCLNVPRGVYYDIIHARAKNGGVPVISYVYEKKF